MHIATITAETITSAISVTFSRKKKRNETLPYEHQVILVHVVLLEINRKEDCLSKEYCLDLTCRNLLQAF